MRLVDLNPRWFRLADDTPALGLTFDCPHCRTQRLGVSFHRQGHEAMDDAVIYAKSPGTSHIWGMSGDSFENLTLSPSVDASAAGHWHGFVSNGEIR